MSQRPFPLLQWHPRYWLFQLGILCLRFTLLFSLPQKYKLSKWIGYILFFLAKNRRHITATNINLCFPQYTTTQQKKLIKQVFVENTMGLFETAMTFWYQSYQLTMTTHFHGIEHLQQAQASGKGVILIGAHYSNLDLGGALIARDFPIDIIYRPHNNIIFDQLLLTARQKVFQQVYSKNNIRTVIRRLKKGCTVWYPADQDYGPKSAVFAPFFNIPAATMDIPHRLAKLTNALVMFVAHHRREDFSYEIEFAPPLANFPSENSVADCTRINTELTRLISKYPAQYMWVHRRFKTRPPGAAPVY